MIKMDKNKILSEIIKNRILICCCAVIIFGTIIGMILCDIIPEQMSENIRSFLKADKNSFSGRFFDVFSFPFTVLLMLYFCGFSLLGKINSFIILFIFGTVFGFGKSLDFSFSGAGFIFENVISFFTSAMYFIFFIIIMAESSVASSVAISKTVNGKTSEKPHYNAGKQSVKFITFTGFFLIISAISSYISILIQSLGISFAV